jgi:hypothetical protein
MTGKWGFFEFVHSGVEMFEDGSGNIRKCDEENTCSSK